MNSKNMKLLVFCMMLIITIGSNAQKSVIKTSVSGLLLGDYSLSYERQTFNNQSAQIRIGYFQPLLSPFISENTMTPSEYTFKDSKGSLQSSIEYRFYTGDAPLHGFYLGPYLRYYGIRANYTDEVRSTLFNVEGSVNTLGLGVQLGYQFLINEKFSVDIGFFGAGIDKNSVKLIYTTTATNFNYNSIVDDVSEVFEDIPYFEKRLKNEVNTNNLITKLPFLFPGLRAGFTVGVSF
jgi:hypothetical protein